MRIIAVINQKGGTGKTTTAFNLGHGLAKRNHKVLLIDLDPQRSLSLFAGITTCTEANATNIFLRKDISPIHKEGIWLIPSDKTLAGVEVFLATELGKEKILKEELLKIENNFDYVLFDCPPSLGILTINALVAAKEVVIPAELDLLSMQGIVDILKIIERVKELFNPQLVITGILPCKVNPRRILSQKVLEKFEELYPGKLLRTLVRIDVSLMEAIGFRKSIYDYKPVSHGAEDYNSFTAEFLEKINV